MIRNPFQSRAAGALVWASVCAGSIYGCRRGDTRGPGPAATAQARAAPATLPATRPAAALWINGVAYRFPSATLVLSSQGQGMSATLCSDDPPAAINAGYHGNSFMIEMKLDIDSVDELDGYVWRTVADTTADVDTSTGIFLDGTARQLQPTALAVTFRKRGADWIADLDGQFESLDTRNPAARREPAAATGRLYTQVVEQH